MSPSIKRTTIKQTTAGRWQARIYLPRSGGDGYGYKEAQRTFDTKGQAEAWARVQLEQHGLTGSEGTLTGSEVAEYREAKKIVRGVDLRTIARDWADRNPEAETTVKEAMDVYLTEAVSQMEPTTQANLKSKCRWLVECIGEMGLRDVSRRTLRKHLSDLPHNGTTKNNYVRFIQAFFNWCRHEDQGDYGLDKSPAAGLAKEKVRRSAVKFLSVVDAEAFLRAAEEDDPALLPVLILSMFGGIRPQIAPRMAPLAPSLVRSKEKNVLIPEYDDESETGDRINKSVSYRLQETTGREGDIFAALWAWLDAYWNGKAMDCRDVDRRRKALVDKAKIEWPHDAMRHTFGTMAYTLTENIYRVSTWLGHQDTKVTKKHYAATNAHKADAEKFFQLRPRAGAKPVARKVAKDRYAEKAAWPSDEELLELAKTSPKTQIAASLGVSEAAVRKRLGKINE